MSRMDHGCWVISQFKNMKTVIRFSFAKRTDIWRIQLQRSVKEELWSLSKPVSKGNFWYEGISVPRSVTLSLEAHKKWMDWRSQISSSTNNITTHQNNKNENNTWLFLSPNNNNNKSHLSVIVGFVGPDRQSFHTFEVIENRSWRQFSNDRWYACTTQELLLQPQKQ